MKAKQGQARHLPEADDEDESLLSPVAGLRVGVRVRVRARAARVRNRVEI